jgi:hypothetical protein
LLVLPVISTEWYFVVFDAVMVLISIYAFNIAHPGRLLANQVELADRSVKNDPEFGNSNSGILLDQMPA